MELSEAWLETILKRDVLERNVARVISVEKEDVVNKGDNYASDISRLKMDTVLGSGRMATKSLIMKRVPATELRAKYLGEWGLFKKEMKMYNSVLPMMEDLLKSVGYSGEVMWGRCLYTRPNDLLILEDMKDLGYKMANRREGLDLNHARLVMKSLGRYHALSATLKERGSLDIEDLRETLFSVHKDDMKQYLDQLMKVFADVIDTTWGDEWKVYVPKIKTLVGKCLESMNQLYSDKCDFQVLNHGDCWVNNMMFKYDENANAPSSIRFIDFQMSYYNSYAFDLTYFLTSSVRPEIRDEDYGPLLQEYHTSLTWHLKRFGYAGDNVPSLDDVKEEFKRKSLYALILAAMMLSIVFADPEDAPDMEELLKEFEKSNVAAVDPRPMMGKGYTRAAKSVISLCRRLGTFDGL
ncbi:hypothetical protein AAG570_000671 [Ranatra chinensis]|uniref:CHK kinase-like domain-containing protein n=1 Tax=Ranatra chinensis TaxID=642074 RepID=A0ABD0YXR0_9HEMI